MTEKEYQHIHEGAAIGAVQPRAQLAVAGKDRASFLQGLLTNDVQVLTPGTGCYAAWLTPQGRMLTDLHVLESGGMMLLDVPRFAAEDCLARLEQFHFTEDVVMSSLTGSLVGVWLHGPTSPAVLEAVLEGAEGLAEWPLYRHRPLVYQGEPAVVVRIDQLGVAGFCVYVSPAREEGLVASLLAAGAVNASDEAIEVARIEAGYPLFGVDMDTETIPLEAGIEDRAISTSKGCYVGQEVIIRVLHRGHGRVAKRLVGLAVEGPTHVGAPVFAGEREVGRVTSAGVSPREGAVALGYVHRDFVAP
ncbi:MAG TPA: glycine cleavage T C-terminal barrel domain-containing protein, partial [Vicinamibacterales bacterium]